MVLEQDWHIHTFRSLCAKPDSTVPSLVEKLDQLGMRLGGISDHIDRQDQRDWFINNIKGNREDLATLEPRCRILVGTEATMINPSTCALDADLAAELDFVIVACNHYHLEHVENPTAGTPQAYADHYLDMLLGAAELGFATTISHPFVHGKLGRETAISTLAHYDEGKLRTVLQVAAKAGMAFEINPGYPPMHPEWFRDLIQEARLQGARFTLGSDAHSPRELGYGAFEDGSEPAAICDEIGLKPEDLAWPSDF